MFAVIYTFIVKEGKEKAFVEYWKEMTLLIRKYENSLGSRLHKIGENHYIAYAWWKTRKDWENSGSNLPDEAQKVGRKLGKSCDIIETLYAMDVVEDLLVKES